MVASAGDPATWIPCAVGSRSAGTRDGGRTLVGGSPPRLIYLSERARRLLGDGTLVVTDAHLATLVERLLASGVAEPATALMKAIPIEQVTVVIPVRDRPASLDRLLAGLVGVKAVVVDDASVSPRQIATVVAKHGADLVAMSTNVGPAAARNAGLKAVRTPFVLFADSDVQIDVETISRLLTHFADPELAAVAPRVRGIKSDRSWLGRYEQDRSSLDVGRVSGLVRPGTSIGWLPSAVLAVRAGVVGTGFDESMRFGEDVDLAWRLNDGGWRVRYDATIEARHQGLTRLDPWLIRKVGYGSSAAPLAKRHGAKVAPAGMSLGGAAIASALLLQRRWSLPAAGLVSAIMAARTAKALSNSDHPLRLSVELTGLGVASTAHQVSDLMLRHWWPGSVVAAVVSSRARRTLIGAMVVHGVLDHRRSGSELSVPCHAVARTLDNIAYGTGVWMGAARGRSVEALLPQSVTAVRKATRRRADDPPSSWGGVLHGGVVDQ